MYRQEALELKDRLGVSRSGFIAVVAATLAAALVAAILLFPVESTYRTVAVVGTDPTAVSANERVDFVTDLQAAAFQPSVLDQVSLEVDLPPSVLRERLSIGRLQSSNLIEVKYVADDPDGELATEVVTSVPVAALTFLRRGTIESITQRLEEAETALDTAVTDETEAKAAVSQAVADNDFVPPDVTLRTQLDQLSQLRLEISSLSQSDPSRASLQSQVDSLDTLIAAATTAADDYAGLLAAQDEASTRRELLEQEVITSRDDLAQAGVLPSISVQVVAAEQQSARSAMIQWLAVVIVVFCVAWSIVLWRERRARIDPAFGVRRAGRPVDGTIASEGGADEADATAELMLDDLLDPSPGGAEADGELVESASVEATGRTTPHGTRPPGNRRSGSGRRSSNRRG